MWQTHLVGTPSHQHRAERSIRGIDPQRLGRNRRNGIRESLQLVRQVIALGEKRIELPIRAGDVAIHTHRHVVHEFTHTKLQSLHL